MSPAVKKVMYNPEGLTDLKVTYLETKVIPGGEAASPLIVSDEIGPSLAAKFRAGELEATDSDRQYFQGFFPELFAEYYLTPLMQYFFSIFGRYATLEEVKDFHGIVEDDAREKKTGEKRRDFAYQEALNFLNDGICSIPERVKLVLSSKGIEEKFREPVKEWLDQLSAKRTSEGFSNSHIIVVIRMFSEILNSDSERITSTRVESIIQSLLKEEKKKKSIIEAKISERDRESLGIKYFEVEKELWGIWEE